MGTGAYQGGVMSTRFVLIAVASRSAQVLLSAKRQDCSVLVCGCPLTLFTCYAPLCHPPPLLPSWFPLPGASPSLSQSLAYSSAYYSYPAAAAVRNQREAIVNGGPSGESGAAQTLFYKFQKLWNMKRLVGTARVHAQLGHEGEVHCRRKQYA